MKQLARQRRAMGLTQYRLGQDARIPPWKITFAETGRVKLTPEEIERIKAVLTKRAEELSTMVSPA